MRVAVLSKEYPPEVYGGAGVHVEFLVHELRQVPGVEVEVHAFGAPRNEPGVTSYAVPSQLAGANAALQTLGVDLDMAARLGDADVLHSHTWYANMAGVLGSMLHGAPHVLSAHSLEPSRPWKAEQLGGGYRVSSWAEREGYLQAQAIVAVSARMKDEILGAYPFVAPERVHVIHNGIDTALYRPASDDEVAEVYARYGLDPDRPAVVFVGRITRQKGVNHLLAAAAGFDPEVQLVFCAGAPDTAEIGAETEAAVAGLAAGRTGVVWIREHLPRDQVIALLTGATVFACPSVYEPLGIVNLEAMACGTAVVASDVGGIPEVVVDGVTGTLVHYDEADTDAFRAGLAAAVNTLCRDPGLAAAYGEAGRTRAVDDFGWAAIARRTAELYRSLLV